MEPTRIDLKEFRGHNSSLFTGRPQGEEARQKLNIDNCDKRKEKVIFVVPKGTSSFNPSFYLGFLFKSIQHHGIDGFDDYYSFEIQDENPAVRKVLKENLEDGKRNAINAIEGKWGFKRFLDKTYA